MSKTSSTEKTTTTKKVVAPVKVAAPAKSTGLKKVDSISHALKGIKIISVSSPESIQRIATEKAINPQNVFVRVTYEYEGEQYLASNQLRFFREEGYIKLLDAKNNGTLVNITVVEGTEGRDDLMYLDSDTEVNIKDLFAQKVINPNRRSISTKFGR